MEEEVRPKALMIPFDKFVILDILPPEQCKNVIVKMRDYVQHGTEPENLEAIEQIAFESMRSFMDETVRNYQKTVETNRENGKKGGRPRKDKETDGFLEKPTETHENPNRNQNQKQKRSNTDVLEKDGDACASPSPAKPARFKPPDMEEIKVYFTEKGGTDAQAQRFRDFYESNGWKVGRNQMKSWKAAASGWIARDREKQTTANFPRNKAQLASRPADEAAKAGDFLADAAKRRPLRKKEERT